ncbi:MAG: hypothetical protein ACKO0W_04060, partial [Planctomycetota bacterium]
YLFVLRLLADKLAPDNLNFPQWANLGIGGAVGLAAGVLTVGIAIIGAGHTHASKELLGVAGAARSSKARGQPDLAAGALWVPVHSISSNFFGLLSANAFTPTLSTPTLRADHPNLAEQSLGLFRDTYSKKGLARTVAAPGSIRVDKVMLVDAFDLLGGAAGPAYVVDIHFEPGATTNGQGFAISASQLRLVGTARGGAGRGSGISYPVKWSQPNDGGGRSAFVFDDVSHFVTSPPGTTTLDATFVFPADAFLQNEYPRYLHAMGQRVKLPEIERGTANDGMRMMTGGKGGAISVPPGTSRINPEDLVINDSISPANADLNNLGGMDVRDTNYLFEGIGEYTQGGFRGNKSVVVRGIWAPPSTRVVRLNISRGSASSVDVWNDRSKIRERVGDNAMLALVDDLGRLYRPIGYIHVTGGGDRLVTVTLKRDGGYYEISAYPNLSSSGADRLYALFTPAIGRTIIGVKFGDEWLAASELLVEAPK